MDEIDKAILRLLQMEATIANSTLASRIGLSASACLSRTKRLQKEGIIKQFAAVIDEQKVGLETTAFTFVTLSPHNRQIVEAFVERVNQTPGVLECYNITGSWDYLLKIVAPDISSYRDFVIDEMLEMPGVEKVETLVVLKTEKRSFSLPIDPSNKEVKG